MSLDESVQIGYDWYISNCWSDSLLLFMNNSLVNNTDRIYGEKDPLQSANPMGEFVDTESEPVLWLKLIGLILGTYGLIVGFYALS